MSDHYAVLRAAALNVLGALPEEQKTALLDALYPDDMVISFVSKSDADPRDALLQRLVDLVDSGEFRDGLPLRALAKDAAEALAKGGGA